MKTLAEMLTDNFANANSLRQQAKHEVDKLNKALEKAVGELNHYSRLSDQLARIIEDYVKKPEPTSDRGIRGYNHTIENRFQNSNPPDILYNSDGSFSTAEATTPTPSTSKGEDDEYRLDSIHPDR